MPARGIPRPLGKPADGAAVWRCREVGFSARESAREFKAYACRGISADNLSLLDAKAYDERDYQTKTVDSSRLVEQSICVPIYNQILVTR